MTRTRTPWDELAARRWGPAIGDPTPGIIIDRPEQARMSDALDASADDCFAVDERVSIVEFG